MHNFLNLKSVVLPYFFVSLWCLPSRCYTVLMRTNSPKQSGCPQLHVFFCFFFNNYRWAAIFTEIKTMLTKQPGQHVQSKNCWYLQIPNLKGQLYTLSLIFAGFYWDQISKGTAVRLWAILPAELTFKCRILPNEQNFPKRAKFVKLCENSHENERAVWQRKSAGRSGEGFSLTKAAFHDQHSGLGTGN